MLSAQDSAVVAALFEASAQGGRWPEMLRALAELVQASKGALFTPTGNWDNDGPISSSTPDNLAGLRLGRVYSGEELRDRTVAGEAQGIASDMRAIGLRAQLGVCWLVLTRARGEFRAVDSANLAAIAPHVAQAIDLAQRFARLEEQVASAGHLARRLGIGSVAFDDKGHCVAQDAIARELLMQAGRTTGSISAGRDLVQPVSDHLDLLSVAGAEGARRGYLRATNLPLPEAKFIAQALGLTLSEARLARALGMGDTLAQAAQRLGLTVETARAYSKQIFAKTGLNGQPALMRRLWTSVLVLV